MSDSLNDNHMNATPHSYLIRNFLNNTLIPIDMISQGMPLGQPMVTYTVNQPHTKNVSVETIVNPTHEG